MAINAKHYLNGLISDVSTTTGGVADPYPNSIITLTGSRIFFGTSYDMSQEGLYRFFNEADGTCLNKIAISSLTNADPYKLMSAISSNHLHGTADNTTAYQAVSNAGRYRKWRSQCGYIAGYCNWLLPQLAFQTRVVNVKTLEALNGWDDGHLVVEVIIGGAWRMFDITNGVYFSVGGNHLSTQQFIDQIANDGLFPEIHLLDSDVKFNADVVGGIDLQIYSELYQATPAQREVWYRRIFQSIV